MRFMLVTVVFSIVFSLSLVMFTFLKDYLHMKQGKWANQHIHVRLQVKVIKHRKDSA